MPEAFFFNAFFRAGFFFGLGRFTVFFGVAFLGAVLFDFVDLFRVFFLVAIRAV